MLGFHFDAKSLNGRALSLTSSLDLSPSCETRLFCEDQVQGNWHCEWTRLSPGRHQGAGVDMVVREGASEGWAGLEFRPALAGQELVVQALALSATPNAPLLFLGGPTTTWERNGQRPTTGGWRRYYLLARVQLGSKGMFTGVQCPAPAEASYLDIRRFRLFSAECELESSLAESLIDAAQARRWLEERKIDYILTRRKDGDEYLQQFLQHRPKDFRPVFHDAQQGEWVYEPLSSP